MTLFVITGQLSLAGELLSLHSDITTNHTSTIHMSGMKLIDLIRTHPYAEKNDFSSVTSTSPYAYQLATWQQGLDTYRNTVGVNTFLLRNPSLSEVLEVLQGDENSIKRSCGAQDWKSYLLSLLLYSHPPPLSKLDLYGLLDHVIAVLGSVQDRSAKLAGEILKGNTSMALSKLIPSILKLPSKHSSNTFASTVAESVMKIAHVAALQGLVHVTILLAETGRFQELTQPIPSVQAQGEQQPSFIQQSLVMLVEQLALIDCPLSLLVSYVKDVPHAAEILSALTSRRQLPPCEKAILQYVEQLAAIGLTQSASEVCTIQAGRIMQTRDTNTGHIVHIAQTLLWLSRARSASNDNLCKQLLLQLWLKVSVAVVNCRVFFTTLHFLPSNISKDPSHLDIALYDEQNQVQDEEKRVESIKVLVTLLMEAESAVHAMTTSSNPELSQLTQALDVYYKAVKAALLFQQQLFVKQKEGGAVQDNNTLSFSDTSALRLAVINIAKLISNDNEVELCLWLHLLELTCWMHEQLITTETKQSLDVAFLRACEDGLIQLDKAWGRGAFHEREVVHGLQRRMQQVMLLFSQQQQQANNKKKDGPEETALKKLQLQVDGLFATFAHVESLEAVEYRLQQQLLPIAAAPWARNANREPKEELEPVPKMSKWKKLVLDVSPNPRAIVMSTAMAVEDQ